MQANEKNEKNTIVNFTEKEKCDPAVFNLDIGANTVCVDYDVITFNTAVYVTVHTWVASSLFTASSLLALSATECN